MYGALKSGDISLEELQEGIFHLALYRGMPRAWFLERAMWDVADELGMEPDTDALDLEAIDWASESDRLDVGEQKYLSVMAGRVTRGAGAYPHQGVIQTVFAELWPRGVITQRERRLITLACVGLSYAPLPITMHCQVAMETGDVSFRELEEVNLHMAFYAGWPCTSSMTAATSVALQTLQESGHGGRAPARHPGCPRGRGPRLQRPRLPGGVDGGTQHAVEQTGEAGVEVVATERVVAAGAVDLGPHHAGFAQHLEVVTAGRLAHRERDLRAAHRAVGVVEDAQELEANRIPERLQHVDELQLVAHGVLELAYEGRHGASTVTGSTIASTARSRSVATTRTRSPTR